MIGTSLNTVESLGITMKRLLTINTRKKMIEGKDLIFTFLPDNRNKEIIISTEHTMTAFDKEMTAIIKHPIMER